MKKSDSNPVFVLQILERLVAELETTGSESVSVDSLRQSIERLKEKHK